MTIKHWTVRLGELVSDSPTDDDQQSEKRCLTGTVHVTTRADSPSWQHHYRKPVMRVLTVHAVREDSPGQRQQGRQSEDTAPGDDTPTRAKRTLAAAQRACQQREQVSKG